MFEPESDSPLEYLQPPYRRLTIDTAMPREAAAAAIAARVEPRKVWRFVFSREHREFQGEAGADGFKISRIIHYRNSFLPMLVGKFEPGPIGTRVAVTMRMSWPVIVFSWVWFGFLGAMALFFADELITGRAAMSARDPLSLIPFGMLGFGYVVVSASFAFEARKARRILREVLQAPGGAAWGIERGISPR